MVARKRRVTRKIDKRTGGWAWFHSKREPEREAERARIRQERAEKAEAQRKAKLAAQAREVERNQQRARVYESRAKILEAKTRARMAGKTSRQTFWGGKPHSGRSGSSLTRRRRVAGKSVSFW